MAFGLQIKGSHGYVQIDQAYENDALVRKGTVTPNGGGSFYSPDFVGGTSYQTWFADVHTNLPYDFYSVALRCEAHCLLERMWNNGGTLSFRVLTRETATPVEYFVFGSPKYAPAPSGNWGLLIRGGGVTRYDSRLGYMVIVGEYSHKPVYGLPEVNTNFATNGRKIAVMHARPSFQWQQRPGPNPQAPGSYTLRATSFRTPSDNSAIFVRPTATQAGAAGSTTPGGQPVDSNYPESGVFYFIDVSML